MEENIQGNAKEIVSNKDIGISFVQRYCGCRTNEETDEL